MLNLEFDRINCLFISNDNKKSLAYVKGIKIEKIDLETEDYNFSKSFLGSAFVLAGQPILKKRFVMAGSVPGTSIASKYLSTMLPQKLPIRVLGTTVAGRAIGRMIPCVGWTLLAIDIMEVIIESSEENSNKDSFGRGFGGGNFSGGGDEGRW